MFESVSKKSLVGSSFQNSNNAPCVPSAWEMRGSIRGKYFCVNAPRVYWTSMPSSLALSVIPSRADTAYVGRSAADPPPEIIGILALGPIMAIDLVLDDIGRICLSFLRRTIASAAASRKSLRISGVS